MPRVRKADLTQADAVVNSLLDRFADGSHGFSNQLEIIAHSPAACRHLYGLVEEIREHSGLSQRTIEIAVVTASLANACQYCVGHHALALMETGLSSRTVETMLDDLPEGLDDRDLVVRDYARLVTERAWGIRDAVFERLKQYFTDDQIVSLTVRIGLCILFNKFNQALQIDMEEDAAAETAAAGISLPPDTPGEPGR